MSDVVIDIKNLSKLYRLGTISSGTLSRDISSVWARLRGKEDPNSIVNVNDLNINNGDDRVWAIKDISLQVKKGEIIGIIGKNGAGKSTLLKILSRITAPTRGVVKIQGRVASLLEIGTGFHPELTGRENIYLNGAILGMTRKEIDYRLEEIIDFSGIEKYIDTPVKRYSSGMGVRLGFSVAAHLDSDILLVDEVLAVGDISFQKKCIGKIKDISNSGRTILFVSHNLSSIKSLCAKVILLDKGEINSIGLADNMIQKYYEQNIKSQTKINLEERKDRSGNGHLVFKSIFIENIKGKDIQFARSGETLKINMKYNLCNYNYKSDVIISIGVKSLIGEYLLLLRNDFTGHKIEVSSNNKVVCIIPDLPLIPGTYIIDIYSEVDKQILDFVESAAILNVIEGDYFGTGKQKDGTFGPFLVKHHWSIDYI